jgi:hypothetical protein
MPQFAVPVTIVCIVDVDTYEATPDQIKLDTVGSISAALAAAEGEGFSHPELGNDAILTVETITATGCEPHGDDEDALAHRRNPGFCAKCGGYCAYDDDGSLVR